MCNILFLKMIKSEINSIMHLWHFHVKSKTITAAHIKKRNKFCRLSIKCHSNVKTETYKKKEKEIKTDIRKELI